MYVSERLSLSEVINHIATVATGGDREAAKKQLAAAGDEGKIEASGIERWTSSIGSRMRGSEGVATLTQDVWRFVRFGEGRITDGDEIVIMVPVRSLGRIDVQTGRIHAIEFCRADVERLWPTVSEHNKRAAVPVAATPESSPEPDKEKGTPGPKSKFNLLAALEHTLTKGSLAEGPLPKEMRTIYLEVCRDQGYNANAPRGWTSETLKRHGGERIDQERKARAGKS